MSEPLLLAASLLSGEAVGVPPQAKPEDDLWQLVDQMSILDQKRVQAYQRRSQPLAKGAMLTQPEMSKAIPANSISATVPPVKASNFEVAYRQSESMVKPSPSLQDSNNLARSSSSISTSNEQWRSPTTSIAPSSNPQLFSQRMSALSQGQLYTRLKGNSFQTAWAGASQQPTHQQWQQLLQQEAQSVAAGQGNNRLGVLVGDSLSMWFPSELLPEGKLWLNQGISGENSSQILQRLNALDQVRPETIYVMAGVNDLKQGASDATVLNNTRAIIRRLRYQHPSATVVLQSLLPTRMAYLSPQRAVNLNRQLQAIAAQEKAGYLNLHTLFVDGEGKMRSDLSTDGLHLNRRGYQVWQQAMQQAENWVASSRRTS